MNAPDTHGSSEGGFTPTQISVGITGIAVALALGYQVIPTQKLPRVDIKEASKIIKVGDTVGKIFLGGGAYCATDNNGNYSITIPNPSTVIINDKETRSANSTAGMIVSEEAVSKGINIGLWKSPEEFCATQQDIVFNQIMNPEIEKLKKAMNTEKK